MKRKLTVPSHLQVATLVDEDGTPPSANTAGSLESAKAKRKALLRRNTFNTSTELRRDDELEDGEATRREAFSRKLTKRTKKKLGDDQVVLGTRIKEDHINHVMMYNMLTGIRIGVSVVWTFLRARVETVAKRLIIFANASGFPLPGKVTARVRSCGL